MNSVLVTGAFGNVGREVVLACRARGLGVRLAHHRPADGESTVRMDFSDRSTWAAALQGVDGLFLMRPPALSDMKTTLIPFVDAAYAAGVEHIVFLSVAGAERRDWIPHRKVELHLERTGTRWTLLRPGFFAQNLADAYRRDIVEDRRLYVPAAGGRVAFVDARDIGDVAGEILATHAPRGDALTLTGPEAITFTEVARVLTDVLGIAIRYEPASIAGYVRHLRRRGLTWTQIAVQTYLHVGLRRGDAEKVEPTIERVLGRPAHTLRDVVIRSASTWSGTGDAITAP